jgi:hypothetical protein
MGLMLSTEKGGYYAVPLPFGRSENSVLTALKNDAAVAHIPVVMVTMMDEQSLRTFAPVAGPRPPSSAKTSSALRLLTF